MKRRLPQALPRLLLRRHPLPRCGKSSPVLALPYQRFGQPGKAVRAIPHRRQPAGKSLAQAGDSLLQCPFRSEGHTAHKPRFQQKPKPLFGNQRLDRVE